MKTVRRLLGLLAAIAVLIAAAPPAAVTAENVVTLHFFHVSTCLNCAEEEVALADLEARYDFLRIVAYEVTDPDNALLFTQVKEAFQDQSGTPYTVIGGIAFSGYNAQTGRDIETMIVRYSTEEHVDVVAKIIAGIPVEASDFDAFGYAEGDVIVLPIIGEIAIDDLSIGLAAVVIGMVDGFNPCAMWVLVFLISLLADMGDRKRMWLLGGTFLFASAAMYYLFMAAWLNVALSVVAVVWIRTLIGALAIAFGVRNLWRFFRKAKTTDAGCDVAGATRKRNLVDRIRAIVATKGIFLALGGIVVLAVSVNFVELACTAGLPLLYAQILAYHGLAPAAYYGFIGLYVLFFLIDDLVVFAVGAITMRATGISVRYAKWSTLAGGAIMVALGVLLVFFPEIATLRF